MIKHLRDIKTSGKLLVLMMTLYFFIYIARFGYMTAIPYLIDGEILTKTQSGLILSVFFFVYGMGQIIFGIKGDFYSPYKAIFIGTFLSAFTTLGMFFCRDFYSMLILYGLNGVVQSMLFPSIMVIISTHLCNKHKMLAITLLAVVSPLATIVANALIILFSELLVFYYIYLFSAIILFAVLVFWAVFSKVVATKLINIKTEADIKKEEKTEKTDKQGLFRLSWTSGMFIFFFISLFRGVIDNATGSWGSTMIMESYSITPSFSAALAMIAPIGCILGAFAGAYVLKKFNCEIRAIMFFFIASIVPFAGLMFVGKISIIISIICLFLIFMFKYGYYQALLEVPSNFGIVGKSSVFSGIMNATASAGGMLSGYVFGSVAENYGWQITVVCWIGISLAAIVASLMVYKKWRAFKASGEHDIKEE